MNINDIITESHQACPHCGGPLVEYSGLMEKKDACYYKVKASAKVWPSAYASGRLVQCRKKGAANYGNKSESVAEGVRDLGYDAQSLIFKLRRDVEEKRLQPTRQAVLMAARELAGDMDFAPELLVRQVLGQGMAEAIDPTRNKAQRMIYKYFGQIYDYGDDDGLDYLDKQGDLWNQLMDKYNGEIDDIVAREPTAVLIQAAQELKGIAGDMKYELDEQGVAEAQLDEKCWDGYQQQGMKNKGGRQVPNCVPTESVEETMATFSARTSTRNSGSGEFRGVSIPSDMKHPEWREPTWSFQEIAQKLGIPVSTLNLIAFNRIGGFPEALPGLSARHGSKKYYKQSEVKRWVNANNVREKLKQGVAEDLNEFAPGPGGDDIGDDPYKYPKPESYRRSADYFGQFEADHFDREDFDDATGVFKGYWGSKQIAYFKFDNPARTGGNNPGMGWYYEPESGGSDDTTAGPAVDNADERKQQELGMIRQFLKSGNRPNPDSQIGRLMKKHGVAEGATDLASLKAKASKISDKIDAIVKDGGRVGLDDPLSKQLKSIQAKIQQAKKQGVAEDLNEFAMSGDDDGNDGFSDDTLKQLAAQWYNGDEDPRVEQTLAAAGWEIGQDEGYDDTPGVFVVQAGDINGNSYISWPAHELEGLAETADPEIEEMYEAMEQLAEEMAARKGVSVDLVWESFEALDDHMLYETAAWRRKEGKSKKGGLNAKGVASYRRENPGSKLQMAVTTKPSKLKKGSKAAKRRKSFCARMGGVKGPMKKPNGKPTRKALALRKWNC